MKNLNTVLLSLAVLPLFMSTLAQAGSNTDWRYPAEWNCKIIQGSFYALPNGSIVSTSDNGIVNCPIYTVIPRIYHGGYILTDVDVRIIEAAGRRSYCRVYHSGYKGDNIRHGRDITSSSGQGAQIIDLNRSILHQEGWGFHGAEGNYSIRCVVHKNDNLISYRAKMGVF